MDEPVAKPNLFKQLLEKKLRAHALPKGVGILRDARLANQFRAGEKPQPIIRRGGRNGSGKP